MAEEGAAPAADAPTPEQKAATAQRQLHALRGIAKHYLKTDEAVWEAIGSVSYRLKDDGSPDFDSPVWSPPEAATTPEAPAAPAAPASTETPAADAPATETPAAAPQQHLGVPMLTPLAAPATSTATSVNGRAELQAVIAGD